MTLKTFGTVAAFTILMTGSVAAIYLAETRQDIRQQAKSTDETGGVLASPKTVQQQRVGELQQAVNNLTTEQQTAVQQNLQTGGGGDNTPSGGGGLGAGGGSGIGGTSVGGSTGGGKAVARNNGIALSYSPLENGRYKVTSGPNAGVIFKFDNDLTLAAGYNNGVDGGCGQTVPGGWVVTHPKEVCKSEQAYKDASCFSGWRCGSPTKQNTICTPTSSSDPACNNQKAGSSCSTSALPAGTCKQNHLGNCACAVSTTRAEVTTPCCVNNITQTSAAACSVPGAIAGACVAPNSFCADKNTCSATNFWCDSGAKGTSISCNQKQNCSGALHGQCGQDSLHKSGKLSAFRCIGGVKYYNSDNGSSISSDCELRPTPTPTLPVSVPCCVNGVTKTTAAACIRTPLNPAIAGSCKSQTAIQSIAQSGTTCHAEAVHSCVGGKWCNSIGNFSDEACGNGVTCQDGTKELACNSRGQRCLNGKLVDRHGCEPKDSCSSANTCTLQTGRWCNEQISLTDISCFLKKSCGAIPHGVCGEENGSAFRCINGTKYAKDTHPALAGGCELSCRVATGDTCVKGSWCGTGGLRTNKSCNGKSCVDGTRESKCSPLGGRCWAGQLDKSDTSCPRSGTIAPPDTPCLADRIGQCVNGQLCVAEGIFGERCGNGRSCTEAGKEIPEVSCNESRTKKCVNGTLIDVESSLCGSCQRFTCIAGQNRWCGENFQPTIYVCGQGVGCQTETSMVPEGTCVNGGRCINGEFRSGPTFGCPQPATASYLVHAAADFKPVSTEAPVPLPPVPQLDEQSATDGVPTPVVRINKAVKVRSDSPAISSKRPIQKTADTPIARVVAIVDQTISGIRALSGNSTVKQQQPAEDTDNGSNIDPSEPVDLPIDQVVKEKGSVVAALMTTCQANSQYCDEVKHVKVPTKAQALSAVIQTARLAGVPMKCMREVNNKQDLCAKAGFGKPVAELPAAILQDMVEFSKFMQLYAHVELTLADGKVVQHFVPMSCDEEKRCYSADAYFEVSADDKLVRQAGTKIHVIEVSARSDIRIMNVTMAPPAGAKN